MLTQQYSQSPPKQGREVFNAAHASNKTLLSVWKVESLTDRTKWVSPKDAILLYLDNMSRRVSLETECWNGACQTPEGGRLGSCFMGIEFQFCKMRKFVSYVFHHIFLIWEMKRKACILSRTWLQLCEMLDHCGQGDWQWCRDWKHLFVLASVDRTNFHSV